MAELPSWLNRDYNPAETFLKAYQIGSNIAQSKSALAESQRRTNIEAELQRESLQASMLKAQQELAVQQSYNNARINIEKAQLTEAERRNQQVAETAAKQFMIDQQRNQETAAHNRTMEEIYQQNADNAARKQTYLEEKPYATITPNAALRILNSPSELAIFEDENGKEAVAWLKQKAGLPTAGSTNSIFKSVTQVR